MRIATSLIGILLLACGIWLIYDSGTSNIPALAVGIVLALLGSESLIAAIRGRNSILSKLGPLP